MEVQYEPSSDGCYVCGKGNSRGMHLDFRYDPRENRVCASCTLQGYMQGYDRVVHGGFVSMLLDESMAKACLHRNLVAVTAKMEVRFSAPVYIDEVVRVCGRVDEVRGRRILASAVCTDETGTVRATAEGLFIKSSRS